MKLRAVMTLALLGAVLALNGFGQEPPKVTAPANSIYVSADGDYEADPDTALIQFTVSAQADTSEAAYRQAAQAAEQARKALRENGIDAKSAQFSFYSLQPIYDYKSAKQKIVGYRVSSNVTLELNDFSKVAGVIQGLSFIEDTSQQSVNYILKNQDAAKTKAIEAAYARARAYAQTVATAAGRKLGDLFYSTLDAAGGVMPIVANGRVMTMKAEAAPAPTEEFTPQKVTMHAHVTAIFELALR